MHGYRRIRVSQRGNQDKADLRYTWFFSRFASSYFYTPFGGTGTYKPKEKKNKFIN